MHQFVDVLSVGGNWRSNGRVNCQKLTPTESDHAPTFLSLLVFLSLSLLLTLQRAQVVYIYIYIMSHTETYGVLSILFLCLLPYFLSLSDGSRLFWFVLLARALI